LIALALRNLRFHARGWIGLLLGVALASALLTGALAVGDALRAALADRTAQRLGPVDVVVDGGEGFFGAALAGEVAGATKSAATPVLALDAVATGEGSRRVLLMGVDSTIQTLGADVDVEPGQARVSAEAAAALGVTPGSVMILRYERPSLLPRDLALVQEEGRVVPLRLEVGATLPDAWPARISLSAAPDAPPVVLVERAWLAEQLDLSDVANRVLVAGASEAAVAAAVDHAWQLADAGLKLVPAAGGASVLATDRVLLPLVVAAGAASVPGATPVLTWFAERLDGPVQAGGASLPYAFVAGVEDGLLPSLWTRDDAAEVVLAAETAARLKAGVGDLISIEYPLLSRGRAVAYDRVALTVRAVLPPGVGVRPDLDPALSPPIEGMSGKSRCRDWNPGLPVDLARISDDDEAWWSAHGAAPQAFVPLGLARRLWGTAWGDTTGVWFPAGVDVVEIDAALHERLTAAEAGITVNEVREAMVASERPANDFGLLFLGFESILLISVMSMVSIATALALDARRASIGLLRAVGWPPARIGMLFVAEASVVIIVGAVVGAVLGLAVRAALLWGLAGAWGAVIGGLALPKVLSLRAAWLGPPAAVGIALVVVELTLRALLRQAPLRLLRGGEDAVGARPAGWPAVVAVALAVAVVLGTPAGRSPAAAGAFFGAGALVLAGGLLAVRWALGQGRAHATSLLALARVGAGRRPGRSLSVVATLASGAFVVIGVGLGAGMAEPDPADPASGTGGFALYGETVLPMVREVVDPDSMALVAVPAAVQRSTSALTLRKRQGDDASCLQLGTARAPHLLGVNSAALAERGGFSFLAGAQPGYAAPAPTGTGSPWSVLQYPLENGVIPVIGDDSTVTWGLHRGVGDRLSVVAEDGSPLDLQIVGVIGSSVLQGSLLMDEGAFLRAFPSDPGPRVLLVDTPDVATVSRALVRNLADLGAEIQPAGERLERFASVEHTYIAVFRALGGLGLVLGGLGVSLVLLRNVIEREAELAMLSALGWPRRRVESLLLVEHALLLVAGVAVGGVSAVVAAWPALTAADAQPPWVGLVVSLAASVALGLVAILVAARLGARRPTWRRLMA
jgi:putative ABC transport system permease protein